MGGDPQYQFCSGKWASLHHSRLVNCEVKEDEPKLLITGEAEVSSGSNVGEGIETLATLRLCARLSRFLRQQYRLTTGSLNRLTGAGAFSLATSSGTAFIP